MGPHEACRTSEDSVRVRRAGGWEDRNSAGLWALVRSLTNNHKASPSAFDMIASRFKPSSFELC